MSFTFSTTLLNILNSIYMFKWQHFRLIILNTVSYFNSEWHCFCRKKHLTCVFLHLTTILLECKYIQPFRWVAGKERIPATHLKRLDKFPIEEQYFIFETVFCWKDDREESALRHLCVVETQRWESHGRGCRRSNAQRIEEKWGDRTRILYYGTISWRDDFADLLDCNERFLVYSGGFFKLFK